ncbi:MAG: methionyl-tRNA formyltransferase [Bacteroidaceae bacterium]|nr:methionyl-tRNA formyltransferase [Bacteroidaceae bacterium]
MTKESLKIVFMGTPEFAVGTLERLVNDNFNVVAVVTQPDKPVGRHQDTLQPPAVKVFAQEHGIPVLQPIKMKDEQFVADLKSYEADIFVVVAFRMLPEVVWSMPRFGTFNVHAALLPQYRGAAPINWAIINGEKQTGVTTFFLDHDIDTGRIIMKKTFDIDDNFNVENVYDGLMALGADIAVETLEKVIATDGNIETIAQEETVSEEELANLKPAPKIFRETCEINWQQSCKSVYDFIRGLSPIPGAWTTLCQGNKQTVLKIYKASKTEKSSADHKPGDVVVENKQLLIATSDFFLSLDTLQLQGKKRAEVKDFLNGFRCTEDVCVK